MLYKDTGQHLHWIGGNGNDHANCDSRKSKAHLPQLKPVVLDENDVEGAEEEVLNAKENGRQDAEVEYHRLKN